MYKFNVKSQSVHSQPVLYSVPGGCWEITALTHVRRLLVKIYCPSRWYIRRSCRKTPRSKRKHHGSRPCPAPLPPFPVCRSHLNRVLHPCPLSPRSENSEILPAPVNNAIPCIRTPYRHRNGVSNCWICSVTACRRVRTTVGHSRKTEYSTPYQQTQGQGARHCVIQES